VFCVTGSPLVGYGSSPCTDGLGWKEIAFRIYHPWKVTRAPLGSRQHHFSATQQSPYNSVILPLTPQLLRGKRSNVCIARGMLSYMLTAHKLIVHIPRHYSSNFPHASNLKLGTADSSAISAHICQTIQSRTFIFTAAALHTLKPHPPKLRCRWSQDQQTLLKATLNRNEFSHKCKVKIRTVVPDNLLWPREKIHSHLRKIHKKIWNDKKRQFKEAALPH
jgi:hypothetical protein